MPSTSQGGRTPARTGRTPEDILRPTDRRSVVEHDLPGAPVHRVYRTGERAMGAFGVGFRSVLDLTLRAVDGHVCVAAPGGDDLRFVPTSTGWLCTAGPLHCLTASEHGWSLVLDRRSRIEFDRSGRLRAWRSGTGVLDTVTDRRGRIVVLRDRTARRDVHLDWDGTRVVQIATSDGATASYTYTLEGVGAGRLLRVVRPDGVVTYEWGTDAVRRDHRAS